MFLILPYPDTVNHHWILSHGRLVPTHRCEEYRRRVKVLCGTYKLPKIDYAVNVVLHASPPDKRRRDVDNLLKSPLDALTRAEQWTDDSLVEELTINWLLPTPPEGILIVEITPVVHARPTVQEVLKTIQETNFYVNGTSQLSKRGTERFVRLP
jgi:crossover junction endodeoxyribonuclease RusA